jgi:hypothetical protein
MTSNLNSENDILDRTKEELEDTKGVIRIRTSKTGIKTKVQTKIY